MTPAPLRIDRLLWFLRLAPSRSVAQNWVLAGHIRVNGQRVIKSAHAVRAGDVLTLPISNRVRVIEIIALPLRRGPAAEAAACFQEHGAANESDSQLSEMIDDNAPADIGDGSRYGSDGQAGQTRKGARL